MDDIRRVKVLFVCMGNICRSPTAHGVFRKLIEEEGLTKLVGVDSAGTHAYHVGNDPDRRAQATALSRGLDLSDLRARQARSEDFDAFDYIIAMDEENYLSLQGICPAGMEERLYMFLDFAPDLSDREVPDPYYGGAQGFERVFDMVETASLGLLQDIRQRYL
jgi:protein-tyrosine phosphatase